MTKKLFPFSTQTLSKFQFFIQPSLKGYCQLRNGKRPILNWHCPFLAGILNTHVKQLQRAVSIGGSSFGFRELKKLPMNSLDSICCIDNASNIFRVLKILTDSLPAISPGFNDIYMASSVQVWHWGNFKIFFRNRAALAEQINCSRGFSLTFPNNASIIGQQ